MDDGFRPFLRHRKVFDARQLHNRAARLCALAKQIADSGNHLIASQLLKVVAMLEAMAADGPTEPRLLH
jgi:hypothetical protein